MKKSIKARIEEFEKQTQIKPIDALQIELTEKYITPNLDDLEKFGLSFRHKLDQIIQEKQDHIWFTKFEKKARLLSIYPEGGCYLITQFFFKYLLENGPSYLKAFYKEGGVVKMVWGVIKEKYFQTQLQVGNIFLDVSNDTVDITLPKVNIERLDQSTFRNIKNYKDYVKIKEAYHESVIRLNPIPVLKDFFPLIDIKKAIRILNNPVDLFLSQKGNKSELNSIEVFKSSDESFENFFSKIPLETIGKLPMDVQYQRLLKMTKYFNKIVGNTDY